MAGSFVFVSSVETRLSSYRSSSSTVESREERPSKKRFFALKDSSLIMLKQWIVDEES